MENEVLYDSMTFDNKIIADKLGLYDYEPINAQQDINTHLKMAMLRQEVEKNKNIAARNHAIIKELRDKKPEKKHKPSDIENRVISAMDNKQFILLIVFIAIAVCVIQYVSYKSSMSDMMQIINHFVKAIPVATNGTLSEAAAKQT
jgi:hypothetical protein